ncbi:MAG: large conductance mechanosensitive channel protein MscL [Candidatus Pacebacteria bacterium]|nr:large conductance mechanosensitive channel protein MscL [Candidatus Paceibacterota bacterium]
MFNWAKSFFSEFQTFASRGNFLDLAIGLVIGTSFSAVTNSLVTNVLTPPIGLLLGRINFSDLVIPLGGTVKISYGLFFQSILSFIITAFALFLLVRMINRFEKVASLTRKDTIDAPPAPPDSAELMVLKEIRDELKQRS